MMMEMLALVRRGVEGKGAMNVDRRIPSPLANVKRRLRIEREVRRQVS